uniref:hypothetical protein n=1 Tax=Paractinoplanes polyasparticus TaxID=2856853 RepID=UPI001C85E0F6|nr:hypothetical protein [Actinoplanes polyasparticus]
MVDLAAIAENYAQLTGVLTGLAFTALVLILTLATSREHTTNNTDNGAPLCLFIAFFALLLATLLYSVMTGEDMRQARGRAATVELINGLVLGLAVIALLQGVFLLMRDADMDPAAVMLARIVTVVVVPTVAMYFVAVGASDTVSARAASNGRRDDRTGPPGRCRGS